LGTLWMNGKGRHTFMVRTAFNLAEVKHRQRSKRQIIPIEARLFQVKAITAERYCEKATMSTEQSKQRPFAYAVDKSTVVFHVAPTLAAALDAARARYDFVSDFIDITALFADGTEQQIPPDLLVTADKSAWISPEEGKALEDRLYGPLPQTVREQVTDLLRKNSAADYWEKQVLHLSESLLAIVDEELRGIPVEEAGLEKLSFDEYSNMPDTLELLDGIPKPKRWTLYQEGRHRLGFRTLSEEIEILATQDEYARRRKVLRSKPFVASQEPFPSGPPAES
jgi:hypothetical protein